MLGLGGREMESKTQFELRCLHDPQKKIEGTYFSKEKVRIKPSEYKVLLKVTNDNIFSRHKGLLLHAAGLEV